jgi:hypothetical protein
MSADATTTPSASAATETAWAGVEIPKPMTAGRSVVALRRRASTVDVSDRAERSPVTPSRFTP